MTLFRRDPLTPADAEARMNRGYSLAVGIGLILFALWALVGCAWAFPTADPPYLVRVLNGAVVDAAYLLGVNAWF